MQNWFKIINKVIEVVVVSLLFTPNIFQGFLVFILLTSSLYLFAENGFNGLNP